MKILSLLLLSSLLASAIRGQEYNQPKKLFGIQCSKDTIRDKCFWINELTVLASSAVAGKAESHAKAGGTNIAGACGNCTSNGEIAAVFAAGAAAITGLELLNHHILYASEPMKPIWHYLAYVGPAWGYEVPILYQAAGNWSTSPSKISASDPRFEMVKRP
jgi:hypothetical protein